MHITRTHKVARAFGAVALSGLLAGGAPLATVAYAASSQEISSQLSEVKPKLDGLTRELEIAQAKCEDTSAQLEEVQARIDELKPQIAEQQQKVADAQAGLAEHLSSNYKSGGSTTLLELVLESKNFSELVSNVTYANKISEANSQKIEETNALVADLNSKKDELAGEEDSLTTLLSQQQDEQASLESARSETQAYVDGLSSELQSALQAEREAEAKRQQEEAEKAAAAAAEQQKAESEANGGGNSSSNGSSSNNGGSSSNNGGPNNGGSSSNGGSSNNGNSSNNGSSSNGGGSGISSSTASTIINAARTQLGVPYSYGACNPGVAMDCSGLTSYAYACAGISIAHSSRSQYSMVCAAGNLKTSTSALSAGDLVFYQSGGVIYHVAIYIGGGNVIHANGYGSGVVITGVTYDDGFCGGGSPI